MKTEEEKKLYYSIGEVSKKLLVKPSLIRFWEKEFKEIKPRKKDNGRRYYTNEDINLLHNIYNLVKTKGYTLQGARERLKIKQLTPNDIELLKDKLELIKKELINIDSFMA